MVHVDEMHPKEKSQQELSEDNEVRREATKYEKQHLVYVIQIFKVKVTRSKIMA